MTWCDVCAETGSATSAVGKTVDANGVVLMTWCLQHAGTKLERRAKIRVLANVMIAQRLKQNLSLSALARKLGTPKQQLCRWEMGEGCTLSSFLRWCSVLQVEPSFVLAQAGL